MAKQKPKKTEAQLQKIRMKNLKKAHAARKGTGTKTRKAKRASTVKASREIVLYQEPALAVRATKKKGLGKSARLALAKSAGISPIQQKFNRAVTQELRSLNLKMRNVHRWQDAMETNVSAIAHTMASGFDELRLRKQTRQRARAIATTTSQMARHRRTKRGKTTRHGKARHFSFFD